jgi:glycosyltransferase involved in cell wall biosynthesis
MSSTAPHRRTTRPVREASHTSTERLRIAVVGPVAQPIPPQRSGSVETVTSLLTEGLVSHGHDVTLFATAASRTQAKLHATYSRGYHEDPELWPWEVCELLNLSAALERAVDFDVIHYQAEYAPLSLPFTGLSSAPLVVTVHHAPSPSEVAMWSRKAGAPFIAISEMQRRLMPGLDVVATIHHAVDTEGLAPVEEPEGYLLFLGRFMPEKGVLEAIEVARRTDRRLVLAAAKNAYYREVVAPFVDGVNVTYAGEVGPAEKRSLLGRAGALLYPVQSGEPFGLVLAEAMACGTPVAALRRGAVAELVEDGIAGRLFDSLDELVTGLPEVLSLDRARVRRWAVEHFGPERMVAEHLEAYRRLVARVAERRP